MSDLSANEIDSLLSMLRDAPIVSPEGAFTTEEVASQWKCTVETARKRMRPLIVGGKLEVLKVPRMRMDGVIHHVSGYRIVA